MPVKLISCALLPPATVTVVPIHDFAIANEELEGKATEHYFVCCGKGVCGGCIHSCRESGNDHKCPFCNSEGGKTDEEQVEQIMKRVDANDPASIYLLARYYYYGGLNGVQQDHAKAMELFTK
jgi:TPR repeat protein